VRRGRLLRLVIAASLAASAAATPGVPEVRDGASLRVDPGGARITLRTSGLRAAELAVVVNERDSLSVRVGEHYRRTRAIPERNLIRVAFEPGVRSLSRREFARIKAHVDARTPAGVQAFALTWAEPYRVDCMSITAAFAFGFDEALCAEGCELTQESPYFDSPSPAPYDDHAMRPAMSLAGASFDAAKALIERGVRSDASYPSGTGYLVDTSDRSRNVRAPLFERMVRHFEPLVRLAHVHEDHIEDRPDVLFYFTGLREVPALEANTFLPGAIADHLTSTGGRLTDSKQMSSLRWLEAGATGSYGTVVEPCNYPQKFPNPAILLEHYLRGDSLIEAYWKSVQMPGQGIFIGEPLATPYRGYRGMRVPRKGGR